MTKHDVDVVAFATHPDDAEISCGGTLIKLTDAGRKVVVVDLTAGELGTRGTVETRAAEAEAATKILGLHGRENLGLPDGSLDTSQHCRQAVVESIRRWRPRALFLPYYEDRHPDHVRASRLVYEAAFLSGLIQFDTGQQAHRPEQLFHYMGWVEFEPTVVVDITEQADRKLEAIYAYETQFNPNKARGPQTRLTSPTTDWLIRSRMAHLGARIGAKYGEGFLVRGQIEIDDPLNLTVSSF